MSYNNSRTFMQKHGLKIGVGVVSLIILIAVVVMMTGKKEEKPDLGPAARDAIDFLQNTDQSDIDGTAGEDSDEEAIARAIAAMPSPPRSAVQPNPDEEAIARAIAAVQPASTVETYMMVPGTKPPLEYTRFTSS